MKILKPLIATAILAWSCRPGVLWARDEAVECESPKNSSRGSGSNNEDLLQAYRNDTNERPDDASPGRNSKELEKARKRCNDIKNLFNQFKAAADFTGLALAYQEMAKMQPQVHPRDEQDGGNTFSHWLKKMEAAEIKDLVAVYKKFEIIQQKSLQTGRSSANLTLAQAKEFKACTDQGGNKSDCYFKLLPPSEQSTVKSRNEVMGKQLSQAVLKAQSVNKNFMAGESLAKGNALAEKFQTFAENSANRPPGGDAPDSAGGAVAVGANALGSGDPAAAPEKFYVALDHANVPTLKAQTESAPADKKENPIPIGVPIAGAGIILVGAGLMAKAYRDEMNKKTETQQTMFDNKLSSEETASAASQAERRSEFTKQREVIINPKPAAADASAQFETQTAQTQTPAQATGSAGTAESELYRELGVKLTGTKGAGSK